VADEYSFCKMESPPMRVSKLVSPLLAGVRAGKGYHLYARLLTQTRGPNTIFLK
jgi:hypothetical protein